MHATTIRFLLLLLVSTTLLLGYFYSKYRPPYEFYSDKQEEELHQSTSTLQGFQKERRFVLFKQIQGAGFTNQVQEILLFHHLALDTNRIYVYQPFIWNHRKASLPLSAFLRGPTEGTISEVVMDEVCPLDQTRHITIQSNNFKSVWADAKAALEEDMTRCIIVDNWIFSWRFLASEGLHAIWPSFQKYLGVYFSWPDNIKDMYERTQKELNLWSKSNPDGDTYLALHLRRGDFPEHCQKLSKLGTGFTTWSTLPELREAVFPPALTTANETSIIQHCNPPLRRILDLIQSALSTRPHLRAMYVLHDGAWDHLNVYNDFYKLEYALKNQGWAEKAGLKTPMKSVSHSGMIPVYHGERDWKVAVDTELGRRAEVFIGNGYSSLSSHIVALRLADGGKLEDIGLL